MSTRYAALLATGIIALLSPLASEARQPVINTFQEDVTFVDSFNCAPINISVQATNHVKMITWLDNAGNPTRIQVHVRHDGIGTNPETGKFLIAKASFTDSFDLPLQEVKTVGLAFRFKSPDGGVVLLDAGHLRFDPVTGQVSFAAGPHPIAENGFKFPASACAALL